MELSVSLLEMVLLEFISISITFSQRFLQAILSSLQKMFTSIGISRMEAACYVNQTIFFIDLTDVSLDLRCFETNVYDVRFVYHFRLMFCPLTLRRDRGHMTPPRGFLEISRKTCAEGVPNFFSD